jgi:O-antigen biosynthesis protein
MNQLDIIIPTFSNPQQYLSCLGSLVQNNSMFGNTHIITVNNGSKELESKVNLQKHGHMITTGENLGWERGLVRGLEDSKSPFVMFLNDDTYFPISSCDWENRLLAHFKDPKVGAVGPSSNVVMGPQSIFANINAFRYEATFLIGFAMIVRRSALDEVGGIDTGLPGGDDIDLSIRLRKAGYMLIGDKTVFVYHHGFQTGQKVHGSDWNSQRMTEATNTALIKKHGFKWWFQTLHGFFDEPVIEKIPDIEKDNVAKYILPSDKVLEVGCGGDKTVSWSVGVDKIPTGEDIAELYTAPNCVADIVANIEDNIPVEDGSFDKVIARHVFEHCLDIVSAIKNCSKALKVGGDIIVASPNQSTVNTIPLNLEHVHGFTKTSLHNLMAICGLMEIESRDSLDKQNFLAVYRKVGA